MRVLIDAQLPRRLSNYLSSQEVDSKHTLDLPNKNTSTDRELIQLADREGRIIVTKDSDFLDNYILEGQPDKLLLVTTGNIKNDTLIHLFRQNLDALKSLTESNSVIEINEEEIQVHY